MPDVDLIVNCYERTYRQVLTKGWWHDVERQNRTTFASRWCLINNVGDVYEAASRADELVSTGELAGWVFVANLLSEALRAAQLPRRALGRRPYLLDFGLVMPMVGQSPYFVGWDAETTLSTPQDWISPALDLMESDSRVLSTAPRWPARGRDTLDEESIGRVGPWALNYGFSDQLFLVRRADLIGPVWRKFAPASLMRNFEHPWTFESRVESLQRASGRWRASHTNLSYNTNDLKPVVARLGGGHGAEAAVSRALGAARHRWPQGMTSPRLRLP